MKSTVMLVIIIGSFWKPTVIYKKIKKICVNPRVQARVSRTRVLSLNHCSSIGGVPRRILFFLFDLLERLIIYKIKPKNWAAWDSNTGLGGYIVRS